MISFVADPHVANHKRHGGAFTAGVNVRASQILTTLSRASNRALERGSETFVVLGDLFDSSRPEPQLITSTIRALSYGPKRCVTLLGNHDMHSDAKGDNTLELLGWMEGFVVASETMTLDCGDLELVLVPFKMGHASEWLDASIAQAIGERPYTKPRVLGIHLGLRDQYTPPFLCNSPDSISVDPLDKLCGKYRIGVVVAGNWHNYQLWNNCSHSRIIQVGTLAPTGFDNPGLKGYGNLVSLRADESVRTGIAVEIEEIPGPRFVNVTTLKEARELSEKAQTQHHHLYVNWKVQDPGTLVQAAASLSEAINSGAVCGGEAHVDTKTVGEDLRRAVEGTRSVEGLAQRLADFVSAMPLLDNVDRAEILSRARVYLDIGARTGGDVHGERQGNGEGSSSG